MDNSGEAPNQKPAMKSLPIFGIVFLTFLVGITSYVLGKNSSSKQAAARSERNTVPTEGATTPTQQPTLLPISALSISQDTKLELSKIAGIYPLGYSSSTNKIQTLIVYKASCPDCPSTPEFARYDLYLTDNYPENLGRKIDSFEAFGQISTPVAFDGRFAFVYSPQYERAEIKLFNYNGRLIPVGTSEEDQKLMIDDKKKANITGGLGSTFVEFNSYKDSYALERVFTIGADFEWVSSFDPDTGKYIPGSYRVIKRW